MVWFLRGEKDREVLVRMEARYGVFTPSHVSWGLWLVRPKPSSCASGIHQLQLGYLLQRVNKAVIHLSGPDGQALQEEALQGSQGGWMLLAKWSCPLLLLFGMPCGSITESPGKPVGSAAPGTVRHIVKLNLWSRGTPGYTGLFAAVSEKKRPCAMGHPVCLAACHCLSAAVESTAFLESGVNTVLVKHFQCNCNLYQNVLSRFNIVHEEIIFPYLLPT